MSGARGPTGPQGQARSSPAGNKGGAAGSVSRSAGGASKGTASGNKPGGGGGGGGGATGTRGSSVGASVGSRSGSQARGNAPSGNRSGVGGGGGGGGGATGSRGSSIGASVGPRSGVNAPGNRGTGGVRGPAGRLGEPRSSPAGNRSGAPGSVVRGDKATGFRGPTGRLGQGRTSPTGRKPGADIKDSRWSYPVSPMDKKARVGQEAARYDQRSILEGYRIGQEMKKADMEKRGVKFGPPVGVRTIPKKQRGKMDAFVDNSSAMSSRIKSAPGLLAENVKQIAMNMNPNEFRNYVSGSLPDAKLSGSLRGRVQNFSGPRSRAPAESRGLFARGGLVKKSKPRKK